MLSETWTCPACGRPVHLDPSGGMRAHTILSGADDVWECVGTGFNIFQERGPQLVVRSLSETPRKKRRRRAKAHTEESAVVPRMRPPAQDD